MPTITPTVQAAHRAPLPAARFLVLTVATAAAITLVPVAVAGSVPDPAEPVAPGSTVTVPLPAKPSFRMTAPVGWDESAVPRGPDRALVYTRGTDTLSVYATTGDVGVDADAYAARLLRVAAARSGVTAEPAGRVGGPQGLAGPRFRVTDPRGATGELVVLVGGRHAAGFLTLVAPERPVDLRPIVESLRTVES